MTAEIIEFAAARSGKRPFAFREACHVCEAMAAPFVVAGRVTDRYRCDGIGSHSGAHEPYHWKSGDHDVEWGVISPGYDIPPAIKRASINVVPDVK